MLLILLSMLGGAAAIYYFFIKTNYNLPPGPRGLPFLGSVLSFGKHVHLKFGKWADEFGDVMHVNVVNTPFIVLSDYKLVKEVFSQDIFTGRMADGYILNTYADGIERGLIRSEGEKWESLRRFTLRQLRDFGFGKNSMELLIMEEAKEILNWMKSVEGTPVGKIKGKMTLAVVNSLWTVMNGERLTHDDPALHALTSGFTEAIGKASESGGILFFAPWLRHIAPKMTGYTSFRKVMDETCLFFTNAVNDHKKTHTEEFSRDYIDVFLTEMNKKSNDSASVFHGEEGSITQTLTAKFLIEIQLKKALVSVIADLFLAGSDTTSQTLDFTFIYLASFPEVQKKLQKEIEEITGNSRFVSVSDRPSMPYAESVLTEILRCSTIVPLGVPHKALQDTQIKGFHIPKGSIIVSNVHHIHFNRDIWGDPENFRPERFLSPDGKTFKKHEALLPFSIGKRQCLGETLARDTLFLFITNIFQRFSVSPVKVRTVKNINCIELADNIQPTPKAYEVIFRDRQ